MRSWRNVTPPIRDRRHRVVAPHRACRIMRHAAARSNGATPHGEEHAMTRIDGTDSAALRQREGRFWEVQSGRRPGPPMSQFLGGTLQWVDPDEGAIATAYPAKPELANPGGVINGGLLASMLDMTMGGALVATVQNDEIPTTIEMKVSYIRP